MTLQEWGAFGFGLVIGWFLYFVNRYRKSEASFTDVITVIGAVAGAAVTRLFGEGTDLFGAYGIGLAIGFFSYFLVLILLVGMSDNFGADYFLDGRRKMLAEGETIPGEVRQAPFPMDQPEGDTAIKVGVAAGIAAADTLKQGR